MTIVYFIRHAQPNYENHNDNLRELTAKGKEDAKLVTAYLSDKAIDIALSSPYKRAVDTIADFAALHQLPILTIDAFRERKIENEWIEDYTSFCKQQWADFSYKLAAGESLQEVQERNIAALEEVLRRYENKHIIIGSHGTALSTIINYYDPSFGYHDFEKIRCLMPWIVKLTFNRLECKEISFINVFEENVKHL